MSGDLFLFIDKRPQCLDVLVKNFLIKKDVGPMHNI